MLAGSVELMLPMWLHITILILAKYSAASSHFPAQYDGSPVYVNATQTEITTVLVSVMWSKVN